MPTCRNCHEYYYYEESESETFCEVCIGEGWAEEDSLEEEKVYCEGSSCYQKVEKWKRNWENKGNINKSFTKRI